jgi:hypothetical protein
MNERPYVDDNAEQLERMRGLVERCSADDLSKQVNEFWTFAGVLGHIAFWDGRALALAEKLERGLASGSQHLFSDADDEPDEVDWINDATRPLIHAVLPEQLARLAVKIAAATDSRIAELPPEHLWPRDRQSPLNAFRSSHRGAHLDEIEAALDASSG